MAQAQAFLTKVGGLREKRAPVTHLEGDGENIVSAYAADGIHLADIAWRPHVAKLVSTGGLFLC